MTRLLKKSVTVTHTQDGQVVELEDKEVGCMSTPQTESQLVVGHRKSTSSEIPYKTLRDTGAARRLFEELYQECHRDTPLRERPKIAAAR